MRSEYYPNVGAHALFMRTIAGRVHNAGARKVRLCVRLKPWLVKPRIRIDALPLAKQQNRTERQRNVNDYVEPCFLQIKKPRIKVFKY